MTATPITAPEAGRATVARPARGWLLGLDPLLLVATLGLCAISLVAIGAATRDDIPGSPDYYVIRQAIFFAVGAVLMVVISQFDISRLREMKLGIYGVMLFLLLGVTLTSAATRGARSWFELPFFNIQPSELGKVLLIVTLAGFLVDRVRRVDERQTTARILLLALVPAMVVMAQPDLGSALVYLAIVTAVLFVGGTSWKHFAALGALAAVAVTLVLVAAPAVGVEVLKPYQVDRLTAFLEPTEDPNEEGYQQNQSRIAIGAGEKTGRGEDATQTQLNFLPEHHTDFIFAVIGETYGFVGAALVLSLFALLIWRGLRILTMAKNLYGAVIAGGVVAMILWQLFVNVGMSIGICPITGVTLPLVSYGGSSALVTFLALGLLQSVRVQATRTQAAKGRLSPLS